MRVGALMGAPGQAPTVANRERTSCRASSTAGLGGAIPGSCSASTTSQPRYPEEAAKAGDRGEVDGAVPGDGEHAAAYALVEAPVLGPDLCQPVGAEVLQVDVDDAVAEAVDQELVVEAGGNGVAGVKQQPELRPGAIDELGGLVEGLGHHHQVVVVGRRQAVVTPQPPSELREPGGVARDVVGGHAPALGHRRVERIARRHHPDLTIDHHLAAEIPQQRRVRHDRSHFLIDVALGEFAVSGVWGPPSSQPDELRRRSCREAGRSFCNVCYECVSQIAGCEYPCVRASALAE